VAREQNPIVAESHSFASAIEPWHRTHHASTALALLDAHERRYPNGRMHLETRMLRAEIYLAQGRETDALAVLDGIALSGVPRARELQTVRGELRIKAGRCPEGKRDLSDVLERSVADSLAKRAAQALHHCP
jgi:predicted Zn-dependent protease